jgi:hypothetical protein
MLAFNFLPNNTMSTDYDYTNKSQEQLTARVVTLKRLRELALDKTSEYRRRYDALFAAENGHKPTQQHVERHFTMELDKARTAIDRYHSDVTYGDPQIMSEIPSEAARENEQAICRLNVAITHLLEKPPGANEIKPYATNRRLAMTLFDEVRALGGNWSIVSTQDSVSICIEGWEVRSGNASDESVAYTIAYAVEDFLRGKRGLPQWACPCCRVTRNMGNTPFCHVAYLRRYKKDVVYAAEQSGVPLANLQRAVDGTGRLSPEDWDKFHAFIERLCQIQ